MRKEIISTKKAPSAIGPYSQGMIVGDYIFTSGQIPLNPENGELVNEISKATVQVMENLSAVLESAGSSLENVIKTTIYLIDLNDFEKVNEIYGSYFKEILVFSIFILCFSECSTRFINIFSHILINRRDTFFYNRKRN